MAQTLDVFSFKHASVKGEPGIRHASTNTRDCIHVDLPLVDAATEGINKTWTAVLERVPLCYTLQ